jgi:uncharacterized protein involved in exopolysaccharide biosynthesis
METIEFKQWSLRDFLHVIFKRKNQILLIFTTTVFTVVIGTLVVKPTYEAKAQILVKIGRENLYMPPNSASSEIIRPNREDQINSEIELLKSRSLAENVIKSMGSQSIYKNLDEKQTLLKFQKSLSIEAIKNSYVIEIGFKHEDPKLAAKIVNMFTNAYLDQHVLVHKNPKSYNLFEEQSQILKNKVAQEKEKLTILKKQYNITDKDEEQKLLLNQVAGLRTDLNRTISQKNETKSRILQLQQLIYKTPETIPQGEEVDRNTGLISNLETKLIELQLKQKELLTKYTPESRLVKNVEEEIQMVKDKLLEQDNKRYGKSSIGLNETYQKLKQELLRNQTELKALAAKEETQKTQLVEFQNKLDQFNQIDADLNQLQETLDVNRQNYRLYLTKFEESRISDAMDDKKIANISLIESALPPLKPARPLVFFNILIGIFLGGFGGFGLAFFAESMDDSLEKPEDVEKVLQLPLLVSIPELNSKG